MENSPKTRIFVPNILTMSLKLSIIVPVYNVEKYIRSCIESIFHQGLEEEDFEVIIINDGTKDRSMEVIQDIISQHHNITVVNQENQGLSVARNNGIAMAKGVYILMPDSDDLLIENSLKPLLEKALETKVDLVVADFLTMTDEEINNIQTIQQKDFSIKEKTGEQLFLEDLSPYHCFVWRTLFRKEFLQNANLKFVPGIRFQDIPFTHECYLKAQKCIRISWLLNIYRKWSGAATGSFNVEKAKDFCVAIAKTWELTRQNSNQSICRKIKEDMWVSFSTMVRLTIHEIKTESERESVMSFLRKEVPDLKFDNGTKQRITSFFLMNVPHTFIRIRYLYGIIVEDRLLPFYYHNKKHN